MITQPTLARLALTLSAAFAFTGTPLFANPAFDAAVEAFAEDWIRLDPLSSTFSQYLPAAEQDALDRRLIARDLQQGTPIDPKVRAARADLIRRGLAELGRFSPGELTPVQRVSAGLLAWQLRDKQATQAVDGEPYVFDQFYGLQVGLVLVFNEAHPLRNARDVENYLARLGGASAMVDEGIAEARRRAEQGLVPPRFILDAALGGIDRFLAAPAAENLLVVSFRDRLAKVPGLSAEQGAQALATATRLVSGQIIPAYGRIKALLTAQRERATDDAGLWAQPGGAKRYATLLASETTTQLTPDEVHALGLREVARLEAEMDRELRGLGYTEGPLNIRYDKLVTDTQPPATPDPRPAILAEITRIVRDAELRAQAIFDLRPKAPIEIRREPPFPEATTAAHYMQPAPDGSRPGVYWVPLPGPEFDLLDLRTTAYHEAVPGHHFQIALQQELAELPRFRQRSAFGDPTAFVEGWALYAERTADEAGWYEGDPRGRIGYLAGQLFRARRLVVDTGLHAKKWTRQQAIDYGMPASEVERYVVLPGQACAYMIGQLKIIELRDRAKAALGDTFSLKAFHTLLLTTGPVPLDVLASVVDEWIASRR